MFERKAVPSDFSPFETPATMLSMLGCHYITGRFNSVNWSVEPAPEGKWNVNVLVDSEKEGSTQVLPTLAQALHMAHICCLRLRKDAYTETTP